MAAAKKKLKMRSWYTAKYQLVTVQRNILSLFTILAMVAVVAAVIFVKQITASKSLEPFVVEIEPKTGVPTVVEQLNESHFTTDMTLKRYFLNMYVKIAEGYNPATFQDDYKKLMLFSTAEVSRQFRNKFNPRNPDSIPVQLTDRGMLTVRLKSIQFMNANAVQIRIRVEATGNTGNIKKVRDLIAYVEFRFANLNLAMEDRFINPIGFQVYKYSVDDELVQGFQEGVR